MELNEKEELALVLWQSLLLFGSVFITQQTTQSCSYKQTLCACSQTL